MLYCDSHHKDKIPFQRNKRDADFCKTENVKEQVILKIMVLKIILTKAQICTFQSWYNFVFLVSARFLKMPHYQLRIVLEPWKLMGISGLGRSHWEIHWALQAFGNGAIPIITSGHIVINGLIFAMSCSEHMKNMGFWRNSR